MSEEYSCEVKLDLRRAAVLIPLLQRSFEVLCENIPEGMTIWKMRVIPSLQSSLEEEGVFRVEWYILVCFSPLEEQEETKALLGLLHVGWGGWYAAPVSLTKSSVMSMWESLTCRERVLEEWLYLLQKAG